MRRLTAATVLLSAALVAPSGLATAEDAPTPGPTTPGPTTPGPAPPGPTTPGPTTPGPTSSTLAAAGDAPVNTAPTAVDDGPVRVVAGKAVTIAVLANDTDDGLGADGAPATLAVGTLTGLAGRLALDASRTHVVLTSTAADAGRTLTFTYTATDGALGSAPATVTVTVTAPVVTRAVAITTSRTLAALRAYRITGTVSPTTPGPVTVAVQRRLSGRWTTYKSARAATGGGYVVPFSTNNPVRQVFRAVATWKDGTRLASPSMARTVVARADAVVSGPLTRSAVPWSYRPGCPVAPSSLRRITVNRFTYGRTVARGSLVVSASAVTPLLEVFRNAFAKRFPINSMKPTDAYYAGGRRTPTQSDVAAMKSDNTSAFNCRPVTGNPYRVSQHSYGNAIDINTVRNPYVVGSTVYPSFARTYLDRSKVRTGMLTRSGTIAATMRGNGWPWGARWSRPDYQHFSSNGG